MDRNTIIGFILIFAVFFGFSYLNRPSQEQIEARKRYNDSIAALQQTKVQDELLSNNPLPSVSDSENDSVYQSRIDALYGDFSNAVTGKDEIITLENDFIIIKLSSKGAKVYSVELKNYKDYQGNPLVLFEGEESDFNTTLITTNNRVVNTRDLYFNMEQIDPLQVKFSVHPGADASFEFIYSLHPDDYMVDFKIVSNNLGNYISHSTMGLDIEWMQKIRQQEKGRKFEERYARLTYKFMGDDVEQLRETRDDAKEIDSRLKWIGYKDQFFSSVLIAQESFEATAMSSKYYRDGKYLKEYMATTGVSYDPKINKAINLNFYFGPNDYNLLKNYDKTKFEGQNLQLEKLVHLGWWLFRGINKYIIIPIFDWLNSWCNSMGVAILLLTLIVKICLFPLLYKSFMSSAKMRVLKPQIAAITEKYPGQDNAMTRQQKTMELYNQVGINPMSGCLPMLLQMPILLGLFMFFPSAIELRQESFLWATDLSTYDSLIQWNANIPFISKYFGNHISIFCLLMSLTTILNTKYTMDQQSAGTEQMPGMKLMMYSMPVFMFFVLNSYPAGLNYYYLISTFISVLQMAAFRSFVNEDKLLAKLEANKKKPKTKKKSGFMQRLEEAQRQQQSSLKEQQKKQKRK